MEILLVISVFTVAGLLGYLLALFRSKSLLVQKELQYLNEKNQLQLQIQELQTKKENLEIRLQEQNKQQLSLHNQQELLRKNMSQEFELLAQKLLEEKSAKFTELNQKNLGQLLDPLRERLKDFEKKVEDTYSTERSERGHLRGELQKLLDLNQNMSREAHNLSLALKGENKTQGNWGEMILESILERSGLRSGEEYFSQGETLQLKGEEGQKLMPDVVIRLPGDKHIIIDSKMSLKSYEAYSNSENELDTQNYAKAHIKSIEDHISNLAGKKYQFSEKLSSPDFVILFMPLEAAFALAFKLKPSIFQEAWDKNVAIVSPTTLLTTLRTVASLWKQERQQKNALEIARRGGLLYEKFVGFVNDLHALGDKLDGAQKAHQDALKKLQDGKGNLISQVEELKTLGARSEKNIKPAQLGASLD